MDLEVPPSTSELIAQLDEVIEKRANLEDSLLIGQSLKPGPYAVFYHLSFLHGRLQDIRRILERLGQQRAEINKAQSSLDAVPHEEEGGSAAQGFTGRISDLTAKMRLDVETLYIFGNMALDQWAYSIAYMRRLADPEGYKFEHLFIKLQSGTTPPALQILKDHHFKDAIWLRFHLRMYRNVFIEHVDRPWQRGTTMTRHGDDFNFFIPAAVGWASESELKAIAEKLPEFAPEWLKQRPQDYWEWQTRRLLEVIFNQIDEVERQADRQFIENAWRVMGGSTVSYLVLARRLIGFLSESVDTLVEEVAADRNAINFGPPEHGGAASND